MSGHRRQNESYSCFTCRPRRAYLALRMKHSAESDGREQERHGQFGTQYRGLRFAPANSDGLPRAKSHLLERAAIFAQRDLALGSAVNVIEDDLRQAPLGDKPQIADINDAGLRKLCVPLESPLGTLSMLVSRIRIKKEGHGIGFSAPILPSIVKHLLES